MKYRGFYEEGKKGVASCEHTRGEGTELGAKDSTRLGGGCVAGGVAFSKKGEPSKKQKGGRKQGGAFEGGVLFGGCYLNKGGVLFKRGWFFIKERTACLERG